MIYISYNNALEKAIIYIENNLQSDIKVEEVASNTGYSYYHLTRIFSTVVGESVGNYIRKRRLSEAAKELIYSDRKIIDIGMGYGYKSAEAFSRAFKETYFLTPYEYRKNSLDLIVCNKNILDNVLLNHLSNSITIVPKIVETSDVNLAGIRGNTSIHNNVIPKLWEEFYKKFAFNKEKFIDTRFFGICENTGQTVKTMNAKYNFSEFIGGVVSNTKDIPSNMVGRVLHGRKYAVFTHTGSIYTIRETYNYIWGTWFFNTKEHVTCHEDYELYDERFLGKDNINSQLDIYVPID